MKKLLVIFVVCVFASGAAFAAEKGTPAEAKALVLKGVGLMKAKGTAAFSEFDDPKGKFVNQDLYIYVLDLNGTCLSHGSNSKLIGKNFIDLKDTDGKLFAREMINIAAKKGSGWIDYKWTNPMTRKVATKTLYFQKQDKYVVCCGAYK